MSASYEPPARDHSGKRKKRPYYKEPDTRYGRPRMRIRKDPPAGFSLSRHDDLARELDARGFLNEIVRLDTWHDFKQKNPNFEERSIAPGFETADEINRFLVRPSPVTIVEDQKAAKHALLLNMVLIAVDPSVPDLHDRLRKIGQEIRAKHPLTLARPRGRPTISGDVNSVCV